MYVANDICLYIYIIHVMFVANDIMCVANDACLRCCIVSCYNLYIIACMTLDIIYLCASMAVALSVIL